LSLSEYWAKLIFFRDKKVCLTEVLKHFDWKALQVMENVKGILGVELMNA
jgi:hypothetical protein